MGDGVGGISVGATVGGGVVVAGATEREGTAVAVGATVAVACGGASVGVGRGPVTALVGSGAVAVAGRSTGSAVAVAASVGDGVAPVVGTGAGAVFVPHPKKAVNSANTTDTEKSFNLFSPKMATNPRTNRNQIHLGRFDATACV